MQKLNETTTDSKQSRSVVVVVHCAQRSTELHRKQKERESVTQRYALNKREKVSSSLQMWRREKGKASLLSLTSNQLEKVEICVSFLIFSLHLFANTHIHTHTLGLLVVSIACNLQCKTELAKTQHNNVQTLLAWLSLWAIIGTDLRATHFTSIHLTSLCKLTTCKLWLSFSYCTVTDSLFIAQLFVSKGFASRQRHRSLCLACASSTKFQSFTITNTISS